MTEQQTDYAQLNTGASSLDIEDILNPPSKHVVFLSFSETGGCFIRYDDNTTTHHGPFGTSIFDFLHKHDAQSADPVVSIIFGRGGAYIAELTNGRIIYCGVYGKILDTLTKLASQQWRLDFLNSSLCLWDRRYCFLTFTRNVCCCIEGPETKYAFSLPEFLHKDVAQKIVSMN